MAIKFCGLARFDTADQHRVGHTKQKCLTTKQIDYENANQIIQAFTHGRIDLRSYPV